MSEILLHRLYPLFGKETRLVTSPFLIADNWFLNLARAFRNSNVVACSTGPCSATAKNEMNG